MAVFNCFYSIKPQNTPVGSVLVTVAFFTPKLSFVGLNGSFLAEKKCTKRQRKNNLKQTLKKYDCLKEKILEVSSDIDTFSICPIKSPLIFK